MNARDAMPGGGRLEIEVDELGAGDPRRPAGDDVPAGPLAVLAVKDDGVGIPGEIRDRIFEPFFTTKDSGRGTGLGLSTVLGIVQQSGGAVRVESAPGEGAAFRLYLPVHAAAPRAADAPGGGARERGSGTLLLVEDDERLRATVRRCLVEHGYAVVEAKDAARALAVVRALPAAPDLLLTDVILPDGNGVEVAREAGARWPGVPVIFVSGYAGEHLPALSALAGEARLVSKPFTPAVLLAAIREVLSARRALRDAAVG